MIIFIIFMIKLLEILSGQAWNIYARFFVSSYHFNYRNSNNLEMMQRIQSCQNDISTSSMYSMVFAIETQSKKSFHGKLLIRVFKKYAVINNLLNRPFWILNSNFTRYLPLKTLYITIDVKLLKLSTQRKYKYITFSNTEEKCMFIFLVVKV